MRSDRTTNSYAPTFQQQADLSRQIRFPNQHTEQAVLAEFDHQLSQEVRKTDSILIGQANDLQRHAQDIASRAEAARSALEAMELALSSDESTDIEAWSRADAEVERLIALATKLPARFEVLSQRMDDVLGYASELQERFPALHRPSLLPDDSA